MIEKLPILILLLPALILLVLAAFQMLKRPILLVALSIYTVSLDHVGRIQGSTITVNNLLKVVMIAVLVAWMARAGMKLRLPVALVSARG